MVGLSYTGRAGVHPTGCSNSHPAESFNFIGLGCFAASVSAGSERTRVGCCSSARDVPVSRHHINGNGDRRNRGRRTLRPNVLRCSAL